MQTYGLHSITVAFTGDRQMGARTVDHHVNPLSQPLIYFYTQPIIMLISLPVQRKKSLAAPLYKLVLAELNVVFRARMTGSGNVAMGDEQRSGLLQRF